MAANPRFLSADDVLDLDVPPGLSGYEFVDAQPVPVTPASRVHSRLIVMVGFELEKYVREHSLPGEVLSDAGIVLGPTKRQLVQGRLARRYGGRGLFGPRHQVAAAALVGHTQPCEERAGMSPGWPSATGSGPRVTRDVSTVSTPPSTLCAKRSMLRGAGPSSSTLVPRRS